MLLQMALFLFNSWVIFHYVCLPVLSYSSGDEHSGCFHILAFVNSAAVNTEVRI